MLRDEIGRQSNQGSAQKRWCREKRPFRVCAETDHDANAAQERQHQHCAATGDSRTQPGNPRQEQWLARGTVMFLRDEDAQRREEHGGRVAGKSIGPLQQQ